LILGGKERGEREEQNPSKSQRNRARIWAETERETALGFGLARRRPEVEDGPDMWAPHVSGWREARAAAAWAGVGRARRRERKERVGPKSAQRPRRGIFELFPKKQFVK
jgi:hypothetical protein